jgi:hypothetical protein
MEIDKSLVIKGENVELTLIFRINFFKLTLNSKHLKRVDWSLFTNKNYAYIKEPLTDSNFENYYLEIERMDDIFRIKGNSRSGSVFEIQLQFEQVEQEFIKLDKWCKKYITF